MSLSQSKWNMGCHVLDGVFFGAAMVTLSRQIVIPNMIADLTDSALVLGLVPLAIQFGLLLPQMFYAKKVEGLAYKKRAVLVCALLQRAGWLIFLFSLYLRWETTFTLTVLFAMLVGNSLGSGLIIPVWSDWYAKTVPEHMWGRLLGVRRAIPMVLGVGLGKLIEQIMEHNPAPRRYQMIVILGLVFYAVSLLFVALVREERHEGLPNQSGTSWKDYFRGLAAILLRRRDFRAFMIASLLVTLPVVITSTFLMKYALAYPEVKEGLAGTFTMFYWGAVGVGSLVGGLLSDKKSVIFPFRIFPLFVVAGAFVAALSSRPAMVSTAWCLVGFAFGAQMVVTMPALFRFSGPHRRPSYTAVRFTVLGAAAGVVPPLLGIAKDAGILDYPHVFILCAALAFAGWVLFLRMPSPQRAPS